jgi:hypothetical protein
MNIREAGWEFKRDGWQSAQERKVKDLTNLTEKVKDLTKKSNIVRQVKQTKQQM